MQYRLLWVLSPKPFTQLLHYPAKLLFLKLYCLSNVREKALLGSGRWGADKGFQILHAVPSKTEQVCCYGLCGRRTWPVSLKEFELNEALRYVLKHISMQEKKKKRWDLSMFKQALPERAGSWVHAGLTNHEATDAHRRGRNMQARSTEGGVTFWHFIAIKKLGFGCASRLYFQPIQQKMPCLLCKLWQGPISLIWSQNAPYRQRLLEIWMRAKSCNEM